MCSRLVSLLVAAASRLLPASCGEDGGDPPPRIPVIVYHGLTTDSEVTTDQQDSRFFEVRLSAFEAQMAHLHEAGFHTITPSQYRKWVDDLAVSLPDKPVLVTFDDGQTSTQLATSVLERYDFKAVMYVVSGFADGSFGGPHGEPGWYLTWEQLVEMRSTGRWIMQFHAGPRGHAYVNDPADPTCHRYYPCRFGEDDATYRARVKGDVAQGLGATRTAFGLPEGWHGSTFAVPWDDTAGPMTTTEPWLAAYFASLFPVVFVQESYSGEADNQRYRFEVHNPIELDEFRAELDNQRFDRE